MPAGTAAAACPEGSVTAMSTSAKISTKSVILLGALFIAVAFIGVLAGNWFVGLRRAKAFNEARPGMRPWTECKLHEGDVFPSVELLGLDGNPIITDSIIPGKKSIMLFLSISCHPCTEAIESWKEYEDKLPPDLQIFGICCTDYEYAEVYKKKTGFPFPLYCDTANRFPKHFGLRAFPSMVGLNEDGRIIFVRTGWSGDFSPPDVLELMAPGEPSI